MESEARKGYVPEPNARLGSAVTLATDTGLTVRTRPSELPSRRCAFG